MPGSKVSRVKLLFWELRRRRVLGVAAAYIVVWWVVWQVADVAFPALGLPEWTLTLAIVLGLLGFPLALVLGWAYDLEPGGVVRTPSRSSAVPPTPGEEAGPGRGHADGRDVERDRQDHWAQVQDHLQRLIDSLLGFPFGQFLHL